MRAQSKPPAAVVLAAGMGVRLGHDIPKCLVKVGDGCIIDHQLANFESVGIRDVLVVVGFQADRVRKHLASRREGLRFVENKAYMDTQTGKSLLVAVKALGDRSFVQVNGDVMFEAKILDLLLKRPAVSKLAVKEGVVGEEEIKYVLHEGRVTELSKKVSGGRGEAVGVNYFAAGDVPLLGKALDYISPGSYFERAVEHVLPFTDRPIECVPIGALHAIEIDFPEDLEAARRLFGRT